MITLSRIAPMLFVLLMSFGLTACGGGGGSSDSGKESIQYIDSDGDGVNDSDDAFPNDASETTDSDSDGVGDNADVFPNDASETMDADSDGTGDNADVDDDNNGLIEISSLEQLDWMRNNLNGTSLNDGTNESDEGCFINTGCTGYELTQNLDFDTNSDGVMDANDTYFDYDGDASNSGWLPIGNYDSRFTAIFEGNDYEIRNLYINRPSTDAETSGSFIGLFGYVDGTSTNAEIRNIGLTGELMSITGYEYTGGLIGYTYNSSITASYATGAVTGDNTTGGLVGYASGNNITTSYASGTVTGYEAAGGLVGYAVNSSITASYTTGAVTGEFYTGGFIGHAFTSNITAIYSTGAVTGRTHTGGLVGYITRSSSITASYATNTVTGTGSYVGGLIGTSNNFYGTINISNSHWAIDISNQSDAFGSSLDTTAEVGTTGVTLAQLQCPTSANDTDTCLTGQTLYNGWDVIDHDNDDTTDPINPWIFGDSNTLPSLSVE